MNHNQSLGRRGERLAADWLEAQGYQIRARNVRTPHGEIDLVAEQAGLIVFVEVKTRSGAQFGPPEIAISPRKQAHMRASAAWYAQQNDLDVWRIDVIAVEIDHPSPVFTHFENVLV